jgi:CheY-like chemotaxis protein
MNTENRVILAVEDSDEDYAAFCRVMREFSPNHPVYRVSDGDDALDYLYHNGNYTDPSTSPRPSVVLMDLNLPGTDGRSVIQQVKQDSLLKMIPIVVLTTSASPKDIEACYRYGVNSYMVKPIGVDALKITVQEFFQYWFNIVILP